MACRVSTVRSVRLTRKVRSRLGAGGFGAALSLIVLVSVGPAWAAPVRSRAWAGYQANHQEFQRVSARWTVPALTCSGTTAGGDADSYFFVGLGPSFSSSERVGVREFCTGTLTAYVAYLGMNGLYEAQAVDPAPGDQIAASVSFASGKYRFSLADATQRKSFSLKYACGAFSAGQGTCRRSTAEVVAGIAAPRLSPLADYGRATFQKIAVTDARGRRGSFARNRHWKIARLDEYSGAALAAAASSLSQRGTRFTDVWRHR
jgi:peptidase A4-like protein